MAKKGKFSCWTIVGNPERAREVHLQVPSRVASWSKGFVSFHPVTDLAI